jgi:preprotein translocase subunit YajC
VTVTTVAIALSVLTVVLMVMGFFQFDVVKPSQRRSRCRQPMMTKDVPALKRT